MSTPNNSADTTGANNAIFCGQCGKPLNEPGTSHERCAARSELEPPRYCARCARRMVVQVVPTGWTARCSEHGSTSSPRTTTSDPVAPSH